MPQPNSNPSEYLQILRAMSASDLQREIAAPDALVLETVWHGTKRLDTVWAPFDHVNSGADIVIVGITPGHYQMAAALKTCHASLAAGANDADALTAAKIHASFSGPMRSNLVRLLDDMGIHRLLGLATTAALWEHASDQVHFTSALRYPVFLDGKNYAGQPSMLRQPSLSSQLERWMGEEMRQLPKAIYVPLGPKVGEALSWLAPRIGVSERRVLTGLPHPSGASAERIAYWLGRKPRELLSNKTNPDKLDAARRALMARIKELGS